MNIVLSNKLHKYPFLNKHLYIILYSTNWSFPVWT